MQDIKSEDLGASANPQWQNYRIPLPTPVSRPGYSYDQPAPPSAPLNLMYSGAPPEGYSPLSPHHIPQHDVPRRGSETVALSASWRMNPALTSHRSYPSLKRPFGTFEESPYGRASPLIQEGHHEENKPSIQSDHRLLSFSSLARRQTVIDQYGAPAKMDVAAQMHGMFFLSEMPTHAGDSIIMQPELTCYRRNLFQISGSVTRSVGQLSVINERGESVQVVSEELAISAMESVDGHVIRLIVIPWKTPPVNSPEIPTGSEQEPIPIPLEYDESENEDKTSGTVSQQISWKRLQFRVATANNGRRKELQQHFVLRLKVTATLADGSKACLNESTTAPIVVRGRSPRNFQARKEIPLVGSSASPRGQTSQVSPTAGKKSSLGQERMVAGTSSIIELPKRQFQFDSSNFQGAPVRSPYTQWHAPSQPQPEHTTGTSTPNYVPASSSMPPYMTNMQMQPMHEASAASPPNSQGASQNPSRYYYSPSSSMPSQYDSEERPTKSPRHSRMSGGNMYQTFEAPFATDLQPASGSRSLYCSPAAVPQTWAAPANAAANYAQALQPHTQHHSQVQHPGLPLPSSQHMTQTQHHPQHAHSQPHQQQHQAQSHQPPPPSSYTYAADSYPASTRDDSHNLQGYNWGPAGQ